MQNGLQIRTPRPPFPIQGAFLNFKHVRLILLFETKMLLFACKYTGLLAFDDPVDRWILAAAGHVFVIL